MAHASSLAGSASYPSATARAISTPSPYDQLSGFHFGVVVAMVALVGGRVGRGQRQEHLLLDSTTLGHLKT